MRESKEGDADDELEGVDDKSGWNGKGEKDVQDAKDG